MHAYKPVIKAMVGLKKGCFLHQLLRLLIWSSCMVGFVAVTWEQALKYLTKQTAVASSFTYTDSQKVKSA